ncbi:Maf family protein [Acetivibrio clariflavus]|uniref:dTTP/UTP pyrophosphatase n=1 Tax=Acetivibrio clariflavus (strain DSM 19732 / NBRC 101661 / EBR45) TaxID=720554 RepID=G8LY55_ACECE|nr:Maf family protein [Acetivibrio clariflavus]AEV67786.1 MAF protein [Acetivibrio clariflavus DSM 19732]
MQIILASQSPRRSELLKQLGLNFQIRIADIDESNSMGLKASELVQYLAFEKAKAVAEDSSLDRDSIVIGADTVVVKDGAILGKPRDKQEAFNMLKSLNGSWHEVMTGIAVIDANSFKYDKCVEITRVKMKELKDETINAYINSGEPLDKAGAYGIQGLGAVLVDRIEGCYFNVVGLPISKLSDILKNYGVYVLK